MKVGIWKDERWPDYGISTDGDIEISEDLYRRYQLANAIYDAIQKELKELYKNAHI